MKKGVEGIRICCSGRSEVRIKELLLHPVAMERDLRGQIRVGWSSKMMNGIVALHSPPMRKDDAEKNGRIFRSAGCDKLLKQTGGRIDPFSRIPKKDCWQQVETFLLPLQKKEMRAGWSSAEGSRIGMIGKDQSNLNRSHHSSSSVKATGVAFGSKGMVFSMSPDRPPTSLDSYARPSVSPACRPMNYSERAGRPGVREPSKKCLNAPQPLPM
nr:cytochrome c biogenesis FN, mitochondrial [Tanacetum cinerariifolium]